MSLGTFTPSGNARPQSNVIVIWPPKNLGNFISFFGRALLVVLGVVVAIGGRKGMLKDILSALVYGSWF